MAMTIGLSVKPLASLHFGFNYWKGEAPAELESLPRKKFVALGFPKLNQFAILLRWRLHSKFKGSRGRREADWRTETCMFVE